MNSSFINRKSQDHLCCLPLLQAGSFQVIPGGFLLSVSFIFFFICWRFHRFPSLHIQHCDIIPVGEPFHLSRECRLRQSKPIANYAVIKLGMDYPFSPLPCYLLCAWRLLSFHCQSFASLNLCISFNVPPLVMVPRTALAGAPHSEARSLCYPGAVPAAACKVLLFWGCFSTMIFTWVRIQLCWKAAADVSRILWFEEATGIWHWIFWTHGGGERWNFFSVGWEDFAFNLV